MTRGEQCVEMKEGLIKVVKRLWRVLFEGYHIELEENPSKTKSKVDKYQLIEEIGKDGTKRLISPKGIEFYFHLDYRPNKGPPYAGFAETLGVVGVKSKKEFRETLKRYSSEIEERLIPENLKIPKKYIS